MEGSVSSVRQWQRSLWIVSEKEKMRMCTKKLSDVGDDIKVWGMKHIFHLHMQNQGQK